MERSFEKLTNSMQSLLHAATASDADFSKVSSLPDCVAYFAGLCVCKEAVSLILQVCVSAK